MISKKHYLLVILLLIAGLVTSVVLVPSRKEMALMEMKDKHFEIARKAYEEQMAKGAMTLITANHLADLYLQSGEIDKAIALMEKASAANPDNMDARDKLGTLYQYAQRPADYLHNLEERNRLKPTLQTLKALSDIYNFNGQYDKQTAVLKQMIEMEHGKNPKSFTDLANIQAAAHDYAGAADTLQDFRKRLPDKFSFRELKLMVSLLFDANEPQKAAEAATQWITANNDPADGAQLVNIVHFRGNAVMGNALLSHFSPDQINGTEDLLQEYVLVSLDLGKSDEVYRQLKALHESGHLSMAFNGRLLLLAAAQGDQKLTTDILAHTNLTELNDTQLLALLDSALARNDTELLDALRHVVSTDASRETHALLVAALAVSGHAAGAGAELAQLDRVLLTRDQILQIASICAQAKQSDCADHFIAKLPPADMMNDTDIASVGDLYLEMQQWDKGYAWLHDAQKSHPSPAIDTMLTQFAAARGDDAQVKAWLDKAGNAATEHTLEDMYYTAEKNQHLQTALIIIEFFHAHEDSQKSRNMLADIDLKMEQFEPVVKLLRDVNPKSITDEDNYLAALVHLAPLSPAYHKELADYAVTAMHSDASNNRKMEILYVLMNAKSADIAIPLLRDMAKTGDDQQKRDIAYLMLDKGYGTDGETIMMALAANAPPDSKDVQELLYIWGPKPTAEQMQWLETRFSQATGKERKEWADIIGNAASSDFALGFIKRYPDSMDYPAIADKYFLALLSSGSFPSKLNAYIASHNIEQLHSFGHAASEYGFRREARKAYEAALAINPSDMVALREAGIVASDQADYPASERYLKQYINAYNSGTVRDPNAYRAFFYYGELQRHNHHLEAAKPFYSDAYNLLKPATNPTSEMLSMKAQSLVWMGDTDEGLKVFAAAQRQYPHDNSLKADYIDTLTDLKRYNDARQLLPH